MANPGNLNIKHAVSSSYHHQINGQVELYIKFIKQSIKNALILNQIYIYFIADEINPTRTRIAKSCDAII